MNAEKIMEGLSRFAFATASLVLMALSFALVVYGVVEVASVGISSWKDAGGTVLSAIGYVVIAMAVFDVAKYFIEEEVIRDTHVSAPTRVRRFLSRFMVVVVVAVAIEGLVATFKAIHEDMAQLQYAALILGAVGLLLAGWGIFIRLNRYAEELEPEAMEAAKREDRKLR